MSLSGTTPHLGLPYPTSTDLVSNGPTVIQALATALDGSALYQQGTYAARPTTVPASGNLYYATDTGQLFVSNGTAWQAVAPVDAAAGTASLRTLGTGATQAAAGNDQRFVDPPWTVDINPFLTPSTQTNWSMIVGNSGDIGGGQMQSTGAQNAQIGWDIILGAGTWTFSLIHSNGPGRGIYAVSLDGSSKGTIDGYASSVVDNVISTITGITVPSSGKTRLALTMATKNASSSNYYGYIQAVGLRRTA